MAKSSNLVGKNQSETALCGRMAYILILKQNQEYACYALPRQKWIIFFTLKKLVVKV